MDLATTQEWMQRVVMHPGGVAAVVDDTLTDILHPSETQTATERLHVYGYAYYARLISVLKQDFAAVHHAVGEEGFAALARAFLAKYPSNHYNLNMLGSRFPAYVRDDAAQLEHQAFLAELAALERAIQEVFDERRAPTVPADALWDIPEDLWYDTRLTVAPAFRLFEFSYQTNPYLQGVRQKAGPQIPDSPETSWVMVYRHDWTVYRADLTAPRYTLIKSLADGETLGEAIEATLNAPGVEPEQLAGQLREWFRIWMGAGVFSVIEAPTL